MEENDAIIALKQKANEIKYKPGVDVIEETSYVFSYLFGWEEHKVTFKIITLDMQ